MYKNPKSVLVVVYCSYSQRFLMLQRKDDPTFWQSITGSMEQQEKPRQTAVREIHEEIGINLHTSRCPLIDLKRHVTFAIFPQFKHRYAPNITHNLEHWFALILPNEAIPILTEHTDYQWLSTDFACQLTPSPNNADAILLITELFS